MLTCMLRILLLFVFASQIFGCNSVDIRQIERGHHISVDEEGHALGHLKNKVQTDFTDKADFTDKGQLTGEEFQAEYIVPILQKMEEYVIKQHAKQQPAKILLFIHGGLNSYEEGLEHIKKFLNAQTATEEDKVTLKFPNLSSYFLLSLNWEAGLRSALKDHFLHIRFGERSPFLAPSTAPIVLLHDLGESIVKAPDAVYSELEDLFQNQSADFTSAMLTTALIASGYGLPIAALHPTLTIASVMPYATYATAGTYGPYFFWPDVTRYLFGPIRMASAPFVEGFGTPAWGMLKRRPDLLLFNPETAKDGAMGKLLKALTGKIKEDKWQTERCNNDKPTDHPCVELTLLGHSMGAMVSDRILTTLSQELTFKHVIYMGAANSIADFQVSVIPYLRKHEETEFWSFALSEIDERNETYAADLLTRGSLLVWIDRLLERTYGIPQKRFGREVNQEWVPIDDKDAWKRICRISFSGNPARKAEPREHGDFTEADNVALVLGMVKNGCPEPVKLVKAPENTMSDDEFRKDLQQKFDRVPRFTAKSIAGIADNAPYSNKAVFKDEQFLSEQLYEEIGNYFFPIDINIATTDQLALLLRGDRYLARQIFEYTCKSPLSTPSDILDKIPHLNSVAQDIILNRNYVIADVSTSRDSSACIPQGGLSKIGYGLNRWGIQIKDNLKRLFFSSGDFITEKVKGVNVQKIRTASRKYHTTVMSEIEIAGMNTPPL